MEKVLVLGVGNILLSDEGVGVHAINYMQKQKLPENVELLDGGTGGFHLLSLMFEYKRMILIDATMDENPIGTIRVIYPKYSSDFPRSLTTHDIGLKDLLDTAIVLESLPKIILIVITISPKQEVGMNLSNEIENALPDIYKKVLEQAREISL